MRHLWGVRQAWASYAEHDEALYREAHRRLDLSLTQFNKCASTGG